MSQTVREIRIPTAHGAVTGLLYVPTRAEVLLVLAHGAGAGIRHAFFAAIVPLLGRRGVATLRYQFPSVEAGRRRPDTPAVAQQVVRDAVVAARELAGDLPLFAGGKSFGGRMTSQAQAREPLPDVRGLVFLGFPLHPAGKPSRQRADHLSGVAIPMLFVQGTRDALATLDLLRPVVDAIAAQATLAVVEGGDHSFSVLKSSGRSAAEVMGGVANAVALWARGVGSDEPVRDFRS